MTNDTQHLGKIIVLELRGWILREPLWGQSFAGYPNAGTIICHHLDSYEDVRHLRHAGDAVLEGKSGAGWNLEETNVFDSELQHG